jgi:hypothetical protein
MGENIIWIQCTLVGWQAVRRKKVISEARKEGK